MTFDEWLKTTNITTDDTLLYNWGITVWQAAMAAVPAQPAATKVLIERLHARTESPPCNADGTYTVGNCRPDALCQEAATEIERLCAAVALFTDNRSKQMLTDDQLDDIAQAASKGNLFDLRLAINAAIAAHVPEAAFGNIAAAPAQRQPLSEARIFLTLAPLFPEATRSTFLVSVARAIESALGITAAPAAQKGE